MKDKIKSFLYDIYCSHIYHCSDSMLSRVFVENCKKNYINPFQKVEGEEKYIEFWRKAFRKGKLMCILIVCFLTIWAASLISFQK